MSRNQIFKNSILAFVILTGFTSYASADPLSDRLRNDPSLIDRSTTNNPNFLHAGEPEFTGSLKNPGEQQMLTSKCSYDSFYWETIYACNPAYNPADPVYIQNHLDRSQRQ